MLRASLVCSCSYAYVLSFHIMSTQGFRCSPTSSNNGYRPIHRYFIFSTFSRPNSTKRALDRMASSLLHFHPCCIRILIIEIGFSDTYVYHSCESEYEKQIMTNNFFFQLFEVLTKKLFLLPFKGLSFYLFKSLF